MDKNVIVQVQFVDTNDGEMKVEMQAKEGIMIKTVFENLALLLEQLMPLYEQCPEKPFGGIDGAKKVNR